LAVMVLGDLQQAFLRPPGPCQAQRRRAIHIRHRTRACAGLRCLNQQRTRRPDKAFMPPSGTTAGTVSDVYRPAALRLHGPGGRRNACWRSPKTITAKAVPL
ncbi:hypothetical protein CKQ79_27955, partial [Klebsiella pneumoniae]